ncbi:MAG: DUF7619 domain-containing protein [Armatimonadota bacterium]
MRSISCRLAFLLGVSFVLCCWLCQSGFARTTGTRAAEIDLTLGIPATGTLALQGDSQSFRLVLDQDSPLEVRYKPNVAQSLPLEVFDANGLLVGSVRNTLLEKVLYLPQVTAGEYHIVVTQDNAQIQTPVDFTLAANNSLAVADHTLLPSGGATQVYAFPVTTAGPLYLSVLKSVPVATTAMLYGESISSEPLATATDLYNFIISAQAATANTTYHLVINTTDIAATVTPCTIGISRDVTALTPSSPVSGTLTQPGQMDLYRITATAGSPLFVSLFKPTPWPAYVAVFQGTPNSTPLIEVNRAGTAASASPDQWFQITAPVTGTYFILIEPFDQAASIPAPQGYTLTAGQVLPALSETPTTVSLPGTHSIRCYRMPAVATLHDPLYAFADHNTDKSLRLEIVRGSVTATTAAAVKEGASDLLCYLPQAESDQYYLRVSNSTAPSCQLIAGSHLPTVTATQTQDGAITNAFDTHWYEVPVAANEEVVLELDKQSAFATAIPLAFISATTPPAPTGSQTGDVVQFLTPTTDTTYFVRVSGDPGSYTLRAMRTFTVLSPGQALDTSLSHAGAERWFEVSVAANQPLFLLADKQQGCDTRYQVYQGSIKNTPTSFGGPSSAYAYFPPQSGATRYLVSKRAPDTGFIADTTETLTADSTLSPIADGDTKNDVLASQYQRRFHQLVFPTGRPLVLQGSLPVQIEEPLSGKQLSLGTAVAVAGLGSPAIVVISSTTPGTYTLTASSDVSQVGYLIYSNASVEAKIDLAKTTVGHVKYYAGTNTYLGTDDANAQSLLMPEGTELASGWQLGTVLADADSLQASWRHPANQVNKTLVLRGTSQRAEIICQVDTPRPITFRNALMAPSPAGSTNNYALNYGAKLTTGTYNLGGTSAIYPTVLGGTINPSENWAAFWNSAVNEVYGLTFATDYRLAMSTDGANTVARVICGSGRSSFSVQIVQPKPSTPYQAIQSVGVRPNLSITHTPDNPLVPLGTPITGAITVQNIGTGSATTTTVTCTLPAGAVYVNNSSNPAGAYDAASRTITWNTGTIIAGSTRTYTYQFTVDTATALGTPLELAAAVRSTEQILPTQGRCQVTTSGPTITGVTPAQPGNSGPVTLTIKGTCFSPGSVATLTQDITTLIATTTAVSTDRTELSVLVDVTGLSGIWDLAVTNPGGAAALQAGAVTLIAGGSPNFWCELTGPTSLKVNEVNTLLLQYGNTGSTDEVGRLLVLYIPATGYATLNARDDQGRVLAAADLTNSLAGPLLVWLPRVGPGESHAISVDIRPLVTRNRAVGGIYTDITLLAASLPRPQLEGAITQATAGLLQVSGADQPALATLITGATTTGLSRWDGVSAHPLWTVADETVHQLHASASLAKYLTTSDSTTIGNLLDATVALLKAGGTYPPLLVRRVYTPSVGTNAVTGKGGPLGVGSLGYLMSGQRFNYSITVVNPSTATVAVKDVKITDVLDASFDWNSLQLQDISIAGKVVTLANATLPYHGYVDLRPGIYSMAEITIAYTAGLGKLEVHVNGLYPLSSNASDLLLPNTDTNAPRGEMALHFSVMPKATLASGTVLKNSASISLDNAAAIITNEVSNAIDTSVPSSAVHSLPQAQEEPAFTVSWGGQDEQNGSGLVCYTVYLSDNDGPYTVWQNRVTTTTATYTGIFGHTYRFYSISEDAVGHVEVKTTLPDTSIKIGRVVPMGRGLRLVSVPVMPESDDPLPIMGFAGNKWACYVPGTGYVSYGNDPGHLSWFAPASAVPGKGYWGYWAENKTIEVTGSVVSKTAPFSIALVNGWNLIGNPWTKQVSWDPSLITVSADGQTKTLTEANQLGWVTDYLWGWTPNNNNPDTGQYWMVAGADIIAAQHVMNPWQGYWIKATRNCTLILPPPGNSVQSMTRNLPARRLLSSGWQAQLVLRTATGEDSFNWFGMGSSRDVSRAMAIATPPAGLEPSAELSFTGGENPRAIDLRLDGAPNPVWRFSVASPHPGETTTLSWPDLTALPRGLALVLVDEQTGERRYLRTTTDYRFIMPADGTPATFRIETAPLGSLLITGFSARPSAVRGSGVQIKYSLSKEAIAFVEIRSLGGRLIKKIPAGRSAGDGQPLLLWDGRSEKNVMMPRGMYLITLTATAADHYTVRATTTCNLR